MRKLLYLLSIPILIACGSESSDTAENSDFTFSYSIDTVQVDPGEHLIFITNYMSTAAVSPNGKLLYNLNPGVAELEIIDLEEMAYQESIPLEKEGPEGIGTHVSDFAISDQGDFIFLGYQSFVKANADLELYESFKFQPEKLKGDSLEGKEGIDFGAIASLDGDFLFATYSDQEFGGVIKGLAIVDLQTMNLKKIPIPELESLEEYHISMYRDGNPYMSLIERVWLKEINGKLIVSHTAKNEAFIYDLQADSLSTKAFHSSLTADSKKGSYPKRVESNEEMQDAQIEKSKEVNFSEFIFDDKHSKIWRVSHDMDRMIADSVVTKTVLTIFDSDLNQLHEKTLDFNVTQSLAFFKDGTLYSFINLEDELGFVRIKPNYE